MKTQDDKADLNFLLDKIQKAVCWPCLVSFYILDKFHAK
jgi:hypothetical protein